MSDEIGPEERARRALDEFLDLLLRIVLTSLKAPEADPHARPPEGSHPPHAAAPPE